GSRSPDGRDDRAVAWCRVISGMSWLQVRAHFLLYREWAASLHNFSDAELGIYDGRFMVAMDLDLDEFTNVLTSNSGIEGDDALQDSIVGLSTLSLLEDSYSIGARSQKIHSTDSPFEKLLRVQPSVRGMELYGWAQGLPGLQVGEFTTKASVFDTEPAVPRLSPDL